RDRGERKHSTQIPLFGSTAAAESTSPRIALSHDQVDPGLSGRLGIYRRGDAGAYQEHPRRRTRLFGSEPHLSWKILRFAAVATVVQADFNGRRPGSLLPDRQMFSR